MIKFVHTADIHFGMENYGVIDSKTGIHTRLLDFEKALNYCIDYGIKEDVDFFLFAGDAYKTANPTPTHQRLLLNCFLKLYRAKIPVVIIVGNHDNPLSYGKDHALEVFNQLPVDGFHVISKSTSFKLETKSGPIQIVGIPWPTRNKASLNKFHNLAATDITKLISQGVIDQIKEYADNLDKTIPSILTGHLTVSNGIFSGSEKRAIYGSDPIFLPSDLAIPPFDYVALGHLHRFQELNQGRYPAVVYSGSIERIDFGERKEEKGFCLVEIHEKELTDYKFIEVPTRKFIQIDVHLNSFEDQTEQVLSALSKHELKGSVLKIVYHVPEEDNDKVNLQTIQKACANAHYLANIIPIKKINTREKRITQDSDMNLSSLLDKHFDDQSKSAEHKKKLIEKAQNIYDET